jgi:fumarylpyruvate hydrolase
VDYVLPAPPVPSLPVVGLVGVEQVGRFPIRRIFCVGRNYAEHAREMGHDPNTEPPFFFTKPADALVQSGAVIPFPPQTADLHHEGELVVAIGQSGADVSADQAAALIYGFAGGNDLTRRDLQAAAKAARRPWDMAKGFDNSAVIGAIRPGPIGDAVLRCHVDGQLRQEARLSDMIWPVAQIIAHLSRSVTLMPGDLIMTGTPAGVGPILRGQTCTVSVDGLPSAQVSLI